MEIERTCLANMVEPMILDSETKKISWKWRLKVSHRRLQRCAVRRETKKISWKWRLKEALPVPLLHCLQDETKKISWKWRLKEWDGEGWIFKSSGKQRKSPENGDWKLWRFLLGNFIITGNKENLLKMEIESIVHASTRPHQSTRNKENLLKMEIES